MRLLLSIFLASLIFCMAVSADESAGDIDWRGRQYQSLVRSGWSFKLENELVSSNPSLSEAAVSRVVSNLNRILAVLPAHCHSEFKSMTFYLMDGVESSRGGKGSGLAYERTGAPNFHPNYDPNWNDVIVVYSAKNYVKLTDLWAVKSLMHELGHAYQLHHWQEKQPEILKAWDHAVTSGLYQNVQDVNGKTIPSAYAVKNQLEYFAELSAAYFVGINYFPYDKARLAQYDPLGYATVKQLWRAN